jgi:hypothetical protein
MAVIESKTFADSESRAFNDSKVSVLISTAEGNLEMLSDIIDSKWETPVCILSFY